MAATAANDYCDGSGFGVRGRSIEPLPEKGSFACQSGSPAKHACLQVMSPNLTQACSVRGWSIVPLPEKGSVACQFGSLAKRTRLQDMSPKPTQALCVRGRSIVPLPEKV